MSTRMKNTARGLSWDKNGRGPKKFPRPPINIILLEPISFRAESAPDGIHQEVLNVKLWCSNEVTNENKGILSFYLHNINKNI